MVMSSNIFGIALMNPLSPTESVRSSCGKREPWRGDFCVFTIEPSNVDYWRVSLYRQGFSETRRPASAKRSAEAVPPPNRPV